MTKTLIAIAATAILSTSVMANAQDLGSNLALNTELKAFHKVDAETNHITIEPELRWTPADGPLSIWGEVPITVFETNHASGDNLALMNVLDDGQYPVLELGFDYAVNAKSVVYGETTYDFNGAGDRGEIEVGVKINF